MTQRYKVAFRLDSPARDGLTLPEPATGDVTLAYEGDDLVATFVLEHDSADAAIRAAHVSATRLCRLIALTFGAFQVTDMRLANDRNWDRISEMGWVPLFPSVTEQPDGRLLLLSATGRAIRPVAPELALWQDWDRWEPRIQTALDVFWESRCAQVRNVRFLLTILTLDALLADSYQTALLDQRMDRAKKKRLLKSVRALSAEAGLSERDIDRLLSRYADTNEGSVADAAMHYLSTTAPDGFGGSGAASLDEVKAWLKARGAYVHEGTPVPMEINVDQVNAIIGMAIRAEVGL